MAACGSGFADTITAGVGTIIPAKDPRIRIIGRALMQSDGTALIGWPGVSIHARFRGSSLWACFGGSSTSAARWLALIDGDDNTARVITVPHSTPTPVRIAEPMDRGDHLVELVRLDGATAETSHFLGFIVSDSGSLGKLPDRSARRMEFYGDAMTDGSGLRPFPYSNPYRAYALESARILNAEAHLIARDGIGLVRGTAYPETLPNIYNRTLPADPTTPWDFGRWQPQIVVINVLQSDKATADGVPLESFGVAYAAFLRTLRGHYPTAWLIAALGGMDAVASGSPWPGMVQAAVERYRSDAGDLRVDLYLFEHLARAGTPTAAEALEMARALAAFIELRGASVWES